MPQQAKVTTYLKEIKVRVKNGSTKALQQLALQIEGQTKANITANNQVDTGFMLNSVYTIFEGSSTYGNTDASGTKLDRMAEFVERKIAPEESLEGDAVAAVCVGAEYAVFQEARQSFLQTAAEQVATQAGAICEPVFEEFAG
jgi:hypothetical protein